MITAVRQRCAGIDVHRDFVMVCRMWGPSEGEAHGEIRRFDTTVPGLEELQAWLGAEQCQDVVLESTGPYWEPVGNVNGEGRQIGLANPQEVKHRRGHKTGQNDA